MKKTIASYSSILLFTLLIFSGISSIITNNSLQTQVLNQQQQKPKIGPFTFHDNFKHKEILIDNNKIKANSSESMKIFLFK